MRFLATIYYTAKETHPDRQYMKDWEPSKVYSYSDTYNFDDDIWTDEESMRNHMRHDMALVAGGGYNTDHIEIVRCTYEKV